MPPVTIEISLSRWKIVKKIYSKVFLTRDFKSTCCKAITETKPQSGIVILTCFASVLKAFVI